MKILITGITGFVGSHLADYLIEKGFCNIYGTVRKETKNKKDIESIEKKVHLYKCNLINSSKIDSLIREIKPDLVFHLASALPYANKKETPIAIYQNNIIGTLNILESLRKNCPESKILITGSSEEYGIVSIDECPIKEDHALRPVRPYAISKVAQFFLSSQYYSHFGMKIFYARAFYLTGPRQPDGFVCSSLAKKTILFKKNLIPKITVGNLNVKRDFIDVRDLVHALFLISEKGKYGEVYNICSGKAHSIEEIFKIISKLAKLDVNDFVIDYALTRKNESPTIIGDNFKISSEINWKPYITIEKSLEDLLIEYQKIL